MRGKSAAASWPLVIAAVLALLPALFAAPAFADEPEGEPQACFTFSPSSPLTGEIVTFDSSCSHDSDGTITSRDWDLDFDRRYDDGSGLTASRSFPSPGTYTVKLRVEDDDGDSDTSSRQVTVHNRPPVASFAANPDSPLSLEQVTFTSTSTDSDGEIVSRAWDLDNDGSFDDGNTGTVTRSFSTPGDYTVRLRVIDDWGASDIESTVIAVRNRAPSASFTHSPSSPLSAEEVTFNSSSSDLDGSLARQDWDLDGDGSYDDASGAVVSYSFPTSGDHVVKLRVVDDQGAEAVSTSTVQVRNRAPAADFAYGPASPLSAEPVTFTSSSSDPDGSVAAQSWDLDDDGEFDDGGGASVSREFPRPGDYPVRLLVVDNLGAEMIATRTVSIGNRQPSADFAYGPEAPLSDEEVTFTSSASDVDGTVESESWDLDGDGEFDDGDGPTATRAFPAGEHQVALRVVDDFGGVDTATRTLSVGARPAPPGPADGQQDPAGGPGGTAADSFDTSSPVGQVPQPGPLPSPVDRLRTIQPFPVVRIRGRTDRRGARVTMLRVKAPPGVRTFLRCRGGDCPKRRASRRVRARGRRSVGFTRFRRFETHLRAGVVLRIFATQPGRIGKYTRLKIRRLRPPRRRDRCVMPGALRAARCPEAG